MTGRKVFYTIMSNVYVYGSIPFLSLFRFFLYNNFCRRSHDIHRRSAVFSSFFFSQTKFTFSLLFFLSLSLFLHFIRSLTMTVFLDICVCVSKKKEISSTDGVITIFQFSISSFRQISIDMHVYIRLMLSG